jgi:hypothetical protein
MATQIFWSVDWMNSSTQLINGFSEVVVTCGWRCNGADGDYTGTVYSTCSFTPPPEGDPNFVPYASLTQDDVLGWCWSSGVDKESAEAAVQSQIDTAKNPPVQQLPLPWAAPQA